MKKILTLTVSSSLLLTAAPAQTIPATINYQGRITDSTGMPVGASGTVSAPTAAPVNRKVRFRIYDSATGGARKWSEEQTVTVSLGEFSVLLGDLQGTAVAGEANPPGFSAVFTDLTGGNATRFLGVTVDNGNNTWGGEDLEISPRQQITSTGFAFRAKVAESLASGGVAGGQAPLHLVGVGSSGATGLFQASNPTENISLMLRDNAGAEKAALGVAGASGAFSTASAAGDSILRTGSGNKLILQNGSGAPGLVVRENRVGIGTAAPAKTLQVGASDVNGAEGIIRLGSKSATSGASRLWDIGVPNGGTSVSGKNYSFIIDDTMVGSDPEVMVQFETGNVGIGTIAPAEKLDVKGNIRASGGVESGGTVSANKVTAVGTSGYVFANGGDTDGGLFSPGDGLVALTTNGAERLRVTANGNIGIGTGGDTPQAKLDVRGSIRLNDNDLLLRGTTDNYAGLGWYGGPRTFDTLATLDGPVLYGAGGGALGTKSPGLRNIALTWESSGNVGIGTTAGGEARLVVSGTGSTNRGVGAHQQMVQNFTGAGGAVSEKASIYATNVIHALGFRAFSDERIKVTQGRSDSAEDLSILLNIGVTNYTYKDTFTHGSGVSKKVIAQQVEKVFPQAVRKITDVVPDIFKKAAIANGWVTLATDLKKGDRVRIIADEAEGVHEVLETAEGKFRTAFRPEGREVFVYGREVRDFRTVDYEAISMLNVSATQELKRKTDAEIDARDRKIAQLESRLADLAARDLEQENRLVRLEKALAAAAQPTPEKAEVRTASR